MCRGAVCACVRAVCSTYYIYAGERGSIAFAVNEFKCIQRARLTLDMATLKYATVPISPKRGKILPVANRDSHSPRARGAHRVESRFRDSRRTPREGEVAGEERFLVSSLSRSRPIERSSLSFFFFFLFLFLPTSIVAAKVIGERRRTSSLSREYKHTYTYMFSLSFSFSCRIGKEGERDRESEGERKTTWNACVAWRVACTL